MISNQFFNRTLEFTQIATRRMVVREGGKDLREAAAPTSWRENEETTHGGKTREQLVEGGGGRENVGGERQGGRRETGGKEREGGKSGRKS